MESSIMYAELAMCFGRYRSIQRGARLVLVNKRLEIRQLAGVTSRKIMSSVKTWLLGKRSKHYVYYIIKSLAKDCSKLLFSLHMSPVGSKKI